MRSERLPVAALRSMTPEASAAEMSRTSVTSASPRTARTAAPLGDTFFTSGETTPDGRVVTLPRHVEPREDVSILLGRLSLTLPAQPPPRISGDLAEKPKAETQ